MSATAKNVLIWVLVIGAVALIIWAAFKAWGPGYIDKTRYVAKNPPFDPLMPRIGTFNLGPGVGMSYSQSGQLYSPYASGDEPVLKGHYEKNVPNQDSLEGENDFFTLFQS